MAAESPGNVDSFRNTGWCSTLTLLLICSSFSRENGNLFLISTAQVQISSFAVSFATKNKNKKQMTSSPIDLFVPRSLEVTKR